MAENVIPFHKRQIRPEQRSHALLRRVETQQDFRISLELERQRTDRYGHGFSVLLFDCQKMCDGSSLIDLFAHEVARQVREIDTVGWFDGTQLGIILPQTSSKGTRILAGKLCERVALPIRPVCQVLEYPPENLCRSSPAGCIEEKHSFLPDNWPERRNPLPDWKRFMDVAISLVLIVFFTPVWLLVATGIMLSSGSPILFRQARVGYRGRPFTLLKFRTMESSADATRHELYVTELISSSKPMHKLENKGSGDPRINPFGRFLRRTCLDELPQLINVFRGEMSLVGPRPCLPYEAERYMLWHRRRFDSVPGMTGLWQVNGKNKTTFAEMVRLDLQYEQKRSLSFDLKIILLTFPAIFSLKQ